MSTSYRTREANCRKLLDEASGAPDPIDAAWAQLIGADGGDEAECITLSDTDLLEVKPLR